MLKDTIEKAVNDQLNFELYSGYIYLAMAAYFEDQDLPGFANWMDIQWQEEQFHANKFFHYVNERGGRVELEAIPKPPVNWESPIAAFEHALKHEQAVTMRIGKLIALSREEADYGTESFLSWFIDEQVEEESNVDTIIKQLRRIGDHGPSLLQLDSQLASRVFTSPATEA
jgi:ferritin